MPTNSDVRRLVGARGCEILVERADRALTTAALLWHYTTGDKLPLMREASALRPNGTKVALNGRPVLWFPAEAVYEPTAIKLVQMPGQAKLSRPSVAEMHELVASSAWRSTGQTRGWLAGQPCTAGGCGRVVRGKRLLRRSRRLVRRKMSNDLSDARVGTALSNGVQPTPPLIIPAYRNCLYVFKLLRSSATYFQVVFTLPK